MRWYAVSQAAYRLARPLLFRFDPERIHHLTMRGLRGAGEHRFGRIVLAAASGAPRRYAPLRIAGLDFRNRIGLGAGFDKDGLALRGWAALGLGFAEVGTVTPLPQPGNERPRLFRLPGDEALINRMGFNNAGAAELARHVMLARRSLPAGFVVGVSIGRNKATATAEAPGDYAATFRLVAPVADYVVLNLSSPNTPELRQMQERDTLARMLEAAIVLGRELSTERPLFVKLAPDLEDGLVRSLARTVCDHGGRGVVLGNTSLGRGGLHASRKLRDEPGGLSGRPLLGRTLELVRAVRSEVGDGLAIIASGGVASGTDATATLQAGADLVELWTGLVYRGPGLIGEAIAATAERAGR
jgi:dihydroorotate dehydrogenase